MSDTISIPFNPEAEISLLGSMTYERSTISQAMSLGVSKATFYTTANQILFESICELSEKGVRPDMLALHSHLEATGQLSDVGGPSVLVKLESIVSGNLVYHCRGLLSLQAKRKLITTLSNSSEDAFSTHGDTEQALHKLSEGIAEVRRILAPNESIQNAAEAFEKYFQFLESSESAGGIPTGIPSVDAAIGGMGDGELWVTAGPTSSGKSALSLQLAASVLMMKKRVLIFSLEMGTEEVFGRLLSHTEKIPMDAVMRKKALTKFELGQIVEGSRKLKECGIGICDQSSMTLENIEALTEKEALSGQIGAIVVDYVQLIEGKRLQGENREQQLARYVKRLKQLAKKHSCPVITPSQLNDDGRVRESREIANSANVLLFIGPDRLIVGKNRNGPKGAELPISFQGEFQTFI